MDKRAWRCVRGTLSEGMGGSGGLAVGQLAGVLLALARHLEEPPSNSFLSLFNRQGRDEESPPLTRSAISPSPHPRGDQAAAVDVGSGVAEKTESGSTADFTASRRSVFGP